MRSAFLVLAALVGAVSAPASDLVVNNGWGPPAPANVFDSYVDMMFIHNRGCGWDVPDPCSNPGRPTTVAFEHPAIARQGIRVFETSTLLLHGGSVSRSWTGAVDAFDSSTVEMSGGAILGSLRGSDFASVVFSGGAVQELDAHDYARVTMTGGEVRRLANFGPDPGIITGDSSQLTISGGSFSSLRVVGLSSVLIVGTDFAVDGAPVTFGEVSAASGVLTGLLVSGARFESAFVQTGAPGSGGRITLIPEPNQLVLLGSGVVGLTLFGRSRALRVGTVR